jgi:hypothetical protein
MFKELAQPPEEAAPTKEIQPPNGGRTSLHTEGLTPKATFGEPEAFPLVSYVGRRLGDVGLSAIEGAAVAAREIGERTGIAKSQRFMEEAAKEFVPSAAEAITKTRKAMEGSEAFLASLHSPESQAEEKELKQIDHRKDLSQWGKAGESIKFLATHPGKSGEVIANSIAPSLMMGGAINKAADKAFQLALPKFGEEAARKIADKIAGRVAIAVNGAAEGMDTDTATKKRVLATPFEELEKTSSDYRELLKQTKDPERARLLLAEKTGKEAGLIAAVIGGTATGVTGARAVDQVLAGAGVKIGFKDFLREILEEVPQSWGNSFGGNVAIKDRVDPNQSLTEGGGQAAAMGLVAATGMTGGAKLAGRLRGGVAEDDGRLPEPITYKAVPKADLSEFQASIDERLKQPEQQRVPTIKVGDPSRLAGLTPEQRKVLPFDHALLNGYAAELERRYGLPEGMLNGIKNGGERSNSSQVSEAGARGVMQFIPETWRKYGEGDIQDPARSMEAGAKYLKTLLDRYDGDPKLAAMAYHAGEGNVDKHLAGEKSGVGPRTKAYAERVGRYMGLQAVPVSPVQSQVLRGEQTVTGEERQAPEYARETNETPETKTAAEAAVPELSKAADKLPGPQEVELPDEALDDQDRASIAKLKSLADQYPNLADQVNTEIGIIAQKARAKLEPLTQEETNAIQEQITETPDASRGAQPRVRQESRGPAEGGEGIRGGGPGIQGVTGTQAQEVAASGIAPQPSGAQPSASWVLREKATGKVITETFDKKKVAALNTEKYEAVPIKEYLYEQAAKAKGDEPGRAISPPGPSGEARGPVPVTRLQGPGTAGTAGPAPGVQSGKAGAALTGENLKLQKELDSLLLKRDAIRQKQMARFHEGSATRARTTTGNADADRVNERIISIREQIKANAAGLVAPSLAAAKPKAEQRTDNTQGAPILADVEWARGVRAARDLGGQTVPIQAVNKAEAILKRAGEMPSHRKVATIKAEVLTKFYSENQAVVGDTWETPTGTMEITKHIAAPDGKTQVNYDWRPKKGAGRSGLVYIDKPFGPVAAPAADLPKGAKAKTKQRVDNTRDTLIQAIGKLGGLSRQAMESEGLDIADMKATKSGMFGVPVFRAKGGDTLDGMAEKLVEEGYLRVRDPVELMDKLRRSLAGERVHSLNVGDAVLEEMEQRHREKYGDEGLGDLTDEQLEIVNAALIAPEIISDNAALRALTAEAESHGIDIEALAEQASKETEDGTQRDYEDNYSAKLKAAIEATRASQSDMVQPVARSTGSSPAGAQEGLFAGPTAGETREAGIAAKRNEIDLRNARRDESLTGRGDLFDTGAATGQQDLDVSRGTPKAGPQDPLSRVADIVEKQSEAITKLAESVAKIADRFEPEGKTAEQEAPPGIGEEAPDYSTEYPVAGDTVDGRTVLADVPNTGSIQSELDEYTVLPGIREVSMDKFTLTGKSYSPQENNRIARLADQILDSKEIKPLIVVIDREGPYILEGGHRADALKRLGARSFPAMVVLDETEATGIKAVTPEGEGRLFAKEKGDAVTLYRGDATSIEEATYEISETESAQDRGTETKEEEPGVYATAPIPGTKAEAVFATLTVLKDTGVIKSGFAKVKTPEEAAHALAGIRKSANERFMVLATDAGGKPIAVLSLGLGTIDGASVHPEAVAKAVYSVPGVKTIWYAHNHPSGVPSPSRADYAITDKLNEHFGPSVGVNIGGHLVLAGNKATFFTESGSPGVNERTFDIPAKARNISIPVQERHIKKSGKLDSIINSPASAQSIVMRVSGGRPGVVLLDNRHSPVAFYPMTEEQMAKLRTGSADTGYGELNRAVARANAAAAIVYNPGTQTDSGRWSAGQSARNTAAAIRNAGIRLLDILSGPDAKTSMAELGILPTDTRFYARRIHAPQIISEYDYIVPETPEFEGNMSGDLAWSPQSAESIGMEQLPIRIQAGKAKGVGKGFGIEHLADNARRFPSRRVPRYTADDAENFVRHAAALAKDYDKIYQEEDGKYIFWSDAMKLGLVTVRTRDSVTGEYFYRAITIHPEVRGTWGEPVWPGRGLLPGSESRQPIASQQSPGQQTPKPSRLAQRTQTSKYILPGSEQDRQPRTPVIEIKKRRAYTIPEIKKAISQEAVTGQSRADVRTALVKSLGERTIQILENAKVLRIIQSQSEDPAIANNPDAVRGYWDARANKGRGQMVLVADNIPEGGELGVFLHEGGVHANLEDMIGKDRFGELVKEFDRLVEEGDKTAQAAKSAIPEDTQADHVGQEKLAYLAEAVTNADEAARKTMSGKVKVLAAKTIAAIRAWLYRTGLWHVMGRMGIKLQLKPSDIAALARDAVDYGVKNVAAEGRGLSPAQAMFAKAPEAIEKPGITNILYAKGQLPQPSTYQLPTATQKAAQKVKDLGRHISEFFADPDLKLNPLHGLTDLKTFMIRRMMTEGQVWQSQEAARRVSDMFKGISEKEAGQVYDFITDDLAKPSSIENANLRGPALQVKAMIAKIGDLLVGEGVISEAAHKKYKGRYLPRMYLKYIMGDAEIAKIGVAGKKPSTMGYTKQRIEDLPDAYLDWLDNLSGALEKGVVTDALMEESQKRIDSLIGKGEEIEHKDQIQALQEALDSGDNERAKQLADKILEDDRGLPRAYRDTFLGQIRDPGFLASRAIGVPMRDLAILGWLRDIANNAGGNWVLKDQFIEWTPPGFKEARKVTPGWLKGESAALRERAQYMPAKDRAAAMEEASKMEQMAVAAERNLGHVDEKEYRQVPDTKRYGALAGMYLNRRIYDDIFGMATTFHETQNHFAARIGEWARGAHGVWKGLMVAANPPGQVRNFTSNLGLMWLRGMDVADIARYMSKAASEMKNDGAVYKEAKKRGLRVGTFAAQEIIHLDREFRKALAAHSGGPIKHWHQLVSVGAATMDAASDLYQTAEAWAKLAYLMHAHEKLGMSIDDAALAANDALFDYSLVPQWLRYTRQAPLGVPFATFAYKSLGALADTVRHRPQRLLMAAGAYYATQAFIMAVMAGLDDDEREGLEELLPKRVREAGHAMLLPLKDDDGRWQFVDLSYYNPLGVFTGMIGSLLAEEDLSEDDETNPLMAAVRGVGLFGGPIPKLIAASLTNTDPFTLRKIAPEHSAGSQPERAALQYLIGTYTPPWLQGLIPFGKDVPPVMKGAVRRLGDALSETSDSMLFTPVDRRGDQTDTVVQAMARFVGANVYAVDPGKDRELQIKWRKSNISSNKAARTSIMKDQSISTKEKAISYRGYSDKILRMQTDLREFERETMPALTAQKRGLRSPQKTLEEAAKAAVPGL